MAESAKGAHLELSKSLREKADDLLRLADESSSPPHGHIRQTSSPLPSRRSNVTQHGSSVRQEDGEFGTR